MLSPVLLSVQWWHCGYNDEISDLTIDDSLVNVQKGKSSSISYSLDNNFYINI